MQKGRVTICTGSSRNSICMGIFTTIRLITGMEYEGKSSSSCNQDGRLSRFKEFMIFLGIRRRMNPQGTEGICWDIIAIRRKQDTHKHSWKVFKKSGTLVYLSICTGAEKGMLD